MRRWFVDSSKIGMHLPHGRWVIAQSFFLMAIAIAGPIWPGRWPVWLSVSLGGGFFLYAAWVGIAGVVHLGGHRTPSPAPRAGSTLVTSGIYARMRHPLYAAMMAMGLGWACFWSSGVTLVIAAAFIRFLHAKARVEEALLCETFAAYHEYAANVPRYLPRRSKSA